MNTPIKLIGLAVTCSLVFSLASCTSDSIIREFPTLELGISDSGFHDEGQTRSITPMYSFQTNDELSLYVVNENTLDSYADQSGIINYMGTYTGKLWKQESQVNLVDIPGSVLAFYPYSVENTNLAAIPVRAQHTDYLYGTSTGTVSQSKTQATIRMKHVHALIRFKFQSSTSRSISEIRIQMPESGSINLGTGVLTTSNETIEISDTALTLTVPSDAQFDYQTFILPGDNIRFKYIINGQLYFYKPVTQFKPGKVYNITLTI